MKGGRTYDVPTILSELKFLGCIDKQIFLSMVLRCARERALNSANTKLEGKFNTLSLGRLLAKLSSNCV